MRAGPAWGPLPWCGHSRTTHLFLLCAPEAGLKDKKNKLSVTVTSARLEGPSGVRQPRKGRGGEPELRRGDSVHASFTVVGLTKKTEITDM